MTHQLPNLPYAFDALEPHIDALTMEVHYTRHHQAYVNNLNAALDKHPEWKEVELEDLIRRLPEVPEDIRTAVRNNGGGHLNHSLFWEWMRPGGATEPVGESGRAIVTTFGSVGAFREAFSQAAATRFGSGWAWLVQNPDGTLTVLSTPNQDNPVSDGKVPLLGVDVWEHAYYLKYMNKRPDYLAAWWHVVNWDAVEAAYQAAKAS
jgi:Fe-Mn family superoxide dismutase